ncbi:MAG: hypothetical protein E7004_06500 [Alphaproteobacteria bacterium]|nr:hypothetical protein [Alphaproteobacteria bacterium]
MTESDIKKLPLKEVLTDTWKHCLQHKKIALILTAIVYAVGALALFSWKHILFWPIMLAVYVLWGMYFRFYFDRKPYFDFKVLFNSLVPSTKIVVLTVVIGTILIMLPILPLFISTSPEFIDEYTLFLQGDVEKQGMLILIANVLFMLMSPFLAYRPFLAWISSLIGRSGSLRFAWKRTKGNYLEFLLIALITNLSIAFVRWLVMYLGGNDYITMLFVAPVFIYFNVLSAKAYEFFFIK